MVIVTTVLMASNQGNFISDNNETLSLAQIAQSDDTPPASWLGISTGINYGGILALTGEFKIVKKTTLAAYAGIGTWGYKLGADFRFYRNYPRSMYYIVGLARATGLPEPLELQLETNNVPAGENVLVTIKPVTNLNVGLGFAWKLGRNSRFILELGYALKVSSGDGYSVPPSTGITENSKDLLSMMRPGGLRLGLGLSFGL